VKEEGEKSSFSLQKVLEVLFLSLDCKNLQRGDSKVLSIKGQDHGISDLNGIKKKVLESSFLSFFFSFFLLFFSLLLLPPHFLVNTCESVKMSSVIDFTQVSLYVSIGSIVFNPLFWNIVAREQYRNNFIANLFGGQSFRIAST